MTAPKLKISEVKRCKDRRFRDHNLEIICDIEKKVMAQPDLGRDTDMDTYIKMPADIRRKYPDTDTKSDQVWAQQRLLLRNAFVTKVLLEVLELIEGGRGRNYSKGEALIEERADFKERAALLTSGSNRILKKLLLNRGVSGGIL